MIYNMYIYIPPNELLLCNDTVAILINRVAEKCCCVKTSARVSIRQHTSAYRDSDQSSHGGMYTRRGQKCMRP